MYTHIRNSLIWFLYEFILIGPLFNVLTEAINYMSDVALAGVAFSANN